MNKKKKEIRRRGIEEKTKSRRIELGTKIIYRGGAI
jgi:hypothetical protein